MDSIDFFSFETSGEVQILANFSNGSFILLNIFHYADKKSQNVIFTYKDRVT